MNVDAYVKFLEAHICRSFMQKKGEMKGICQNVLLCEPIKKALKNEMLIAPSIGHVVCPYPRINLGYIVYRTFDKKDLERSYSECFE